MTAAVDSALAACESLRPKAQAIGKLVARRLFSTRGNHSEAHLSEVELAVAVATGVEVALQTEKTARDELVAALHSAMPLLEANAFRDNASYALARGALTKAGAL